MIHRTYLIAASLVFLAMATGPQADAEPTGDFDGTGYVDVNDYFFFEICFTISGPGGAPAFPSCVEQFDADSDGDVDLADFAAFQRSSGHLPIPLRDTLGHLLTVDSTTPYSSRETCAGSCHAHDIDHIANGFLFQQGRTDSDGNIIMRDDFFGDGRPWIQSAGMYGTWRPKNNRRMAPKNFENESAADQTTFWWSTGCSGCHPGGGGMEFDLDGQRLYDAATGQFGYEALGKSAEDVVFDADYAFINPTDGSSFGPARWDVTGVADPDCLFCHRADRTWTDGWDMNRAWRAATLAAGTSLVNDAGEPVPAFASASTAAQGWFSNLEFDNFPGLWPVASKLQVDYAVGVADGSLLTDGEGSVSLVPDALAARPTDLSCWGCHRVSWVAKRGSVWFDDRAVHYAGFNNLRDEDPANDIPPERSTACNFCHRGDIDHNFAKGNSQFNLFRDDLDWVNFRSCRDCHLTELEGGEPNPLKHPDAPDVPGETYVHLVSDPTTGRGPFDIVSCQGCHIPYALDMARSVVDNSLTGSGVSYWADEVLSADPLNPEDPDKSRWYPRFRLKEDSDGVTRLFPLKFEIALYWADWKQNGTPSDLSDDMIEPIIGWRVRQITSNAPLPIVTDDNGDGKLEVNRPEEILAYIQALKGNDSYGRQVAANPVLVKGERVWYEDASAPGGVNSFEHATSGIVVEWGDAYEMHPPVLAATESWGYHETDPGIGCRDCHRSDTLDSPVMDRLVLVDPFGPDGAPKYKTVRAITGLNPP